MKLKMINFPYSSYINYITNYKSTCKSNHYDGAESENFFKGMLYLSQYRCFYCGQSLITNASCNLYFEREHIINKKYYGRNKKEIKSDENKALNKCKYNLIPICKSCNSLKKHIITSMIFVERLNNLETLKHCTNKNSTICTEFTYCLDNFKDENFNPFSEEVELDILHKIYIGDENYITQFQLNKRTKTLFFNLFNLLYEMNFDFFNGGFIKYLKSISNNSLEDKLIDYLCEIGIISDFKIIDSKKLNNLIETIVLLEEFY